MTVHMQYYINIYKPVIGKYMVTFFLPPLAGVWIVDGVDDWRSDNWQICFM